VITSDVTERKLLEEQLRHSQKMEAIGNLAGGVAHDFNNILTAVAGYTELLLGCTGMEDPRRRDVEEIKRATDRARALTSQLLALSRRQVLRPKVICINNVINIMANMLRRVIGEDIELVLDLDDGLAKVMADPGQLEQVILNLTINARDAMPDGGRLTVRTKHIHLDEELSLSIPDARPGVYVLLEITDNGVGMERAVLERIFEPFFSTKEAGRGTGLGLATVYGIVKQHQGSIVAESEPGAGSSFRIYIPVHPEEKAGEEDGEISVEALRGAGEAVLLVEDDGEVRRFACRALGENGYTVVEARTAEEGIGIYQQEEGAFDLIISDVVLPGKTGLQMVEEMLRHNNELRVILISGYADQKIRWQEIRDRGFDFLQKPYALIDLLRAVRDAISR
jgi:nitrogen-specific signal transduction histidine kinase